MTFFRKVCYTDFADRADVFKKGKATDRKAKNMQELISESGHFYKANLHCHSTFSDGQKTPEELKNIYRSAGYSILAISDHNVMVDHSDLNEEDFLLLTASEINIRTHMRQHGWNPCYHFNVFPRHAHNVALPCFTPEEICYGERADELRAAQAYIGKPGYVREYFKANEMVKEFLDNGFLVMLNHPTWSFQTAEDFLAVDGFFAMEVYNHSCYVGGYPEFNDHIFDTILRTGRHIYCTATDDNHNEHEIGTAHFDSLGGFVVIQAKELTQEAVTTALEEGKFFASRGPMFHSVVLDDAGLLHVKTDPVARIALTCGARQARIAYPMSTTGSLTEAVFDTNELLPGYLRLTITDAVGRQAWSQPLWGEFPGK